MMFGVLLALLLPGKSVATTETAVCHHHLRLVRSAIVFTVVVAAAVVVVVKIVVTLTLKLVSLLALLL